MFKYIFKPSIWRYAKSFDTFYIALLTIVLTRTALVEDVEMLFFLVVPFLLWYMIEEFLSSTVLFLVIIEVNQDEPLTLVVVVDVFFVVGGFVSPMKFNTYSNDTKLKLLSHCSYHWEHIDCMRPQRIVVGFSELVKNQICLR